MVRSGRRSSPCSGGGSGSRKATRLGNYWRALEGKDSDLCELVLKDVAGGRQQTFHQLITSSFMRSSTLGPIVQLGASCRARLKFTVRDWS
ncbi:hypothetical protein MA16_Dca013164 [Dendrobium catenatum]|uniref:Uncharacterized protein n=1 Tax=Dendrobium catenatum TaxID=906689 RepID=A0A2I0WR06_9ASPA|nr:hypothetical protein MA16_Dca013164 [Dendrobium catenatum]